MNITSLCTILSKIRVSKTGFVMEDEDGGEKGVVPPHFYYCAATKRDNRQSGAKKFVLLHGKSSS